MRYALPAFALTAMVALSGCASVAQLAEKATAPQGDAQSTLDKGAEKSLYLGIVSGLITQERYQAAIAFLDEYKDSAELSPRYHLLRGDALLGAKRYDDAVAAYKEVLPTPLAADAYNGIARAAAEQQQWADAAINFARASELDPTNADFLNNLGYAQMKQYPAEDFRKQAMDNLERAHELEPGAARIRNNLIVAASLMSDDRQLSLLLGGIGNADERDEVEKFATAWLSQESGGDANATEHP